MRRTLWTVLLALVLIVLLPLGAQAAGKKKDDPFAYSLWAMDAEIAPDDALKSMPPELIRAVSPAEDGKFCLTIPGDWHAKKLRLFFRDKSLTINGKEIHSGDTVSLPLNKEIKFVPADGKTRTLTVCQTGGVPVLWMTTESGNETYIEAIKGNQEPGWLRYVETDGKVAYEGKLTHIRCRGNSTFKFVKKPYQIKLSRSASLSGMKKDRTWILLANVVDRTGIRNEIGLDIARYCGVWKYVPSYQAVDVYLNHDYKGAYLLCEKVEIDSERLDITDLEEATEKLNGDLVFSGLPVKGDEKPSQGARKYYEIPKEPNDITGGYLVKTESTQRYVSERSAFITKKGQNFVMQSPTYPSAAQINYIADLIQSIESAIYSSNGVDKATGRHFTEMIDLTTFAYRYVLGEVTDDLDGARGYFYKDADSIDPMVYVGPIWDLDYTWGARHTRRDPKKVNIYRTISPDYIWYSKVYKNSQFREAADKAYRKKFAPALAILLGEKKDPTGTLKTIDEYAAEVRTSQRCDAVRWPYDYIWKQYPQLNKATGNTFDGQVEYLRDYITQRIPALNRHFGLEDKKNETQKTKK